LENGGTPLERFKVKPTEQILLKGSLLYRLTKWRHVRCQGILTSERLVLGKKLNPMWSVIPRLYSYIRGKKIIFQIPLTRLESMRYDKADMGQYIILRTTDGSEYPFFPDGLFSKRETWIKSIPEAVKLACPGTSVKEEANSTIFCGS
jgi:hypothetical protein